MKKSLKNFLLVCIVALLCFIASFVIQYYFVAGITMKIMMGIAIWCALLGAILTVIAMIYADSNCKNIEKYIFNLLITFTLISMVFFLSTLGNPILNNIGLICFLISIVIVPIYTLYLTIKELIKKYKKHKEKQ